MTLKRSAMGNKGERSVGGRPSLPSKPTPQEPNTSATAPPFGSCGVGLDFSLDLYRSSNDIEPETPHQD